jgi:hypothetical protein
LLSKSSSFTGSWSDHPALAATNIETAKHRNRKGSKGFRKEAQSFFFAFLCGEVCVLCG